MRHFLSFHRLIASSFMMAVLLGLVVLPQTSNAQYKGAAKPEGDWGKGFKTITEKQSEEWVTLLAGDKFDGRGTGQTGYLKAAFFVAGKLAEYGFEPMGDNGTYFQNLPFRRIVPDPERSFIQVGETKVGNGKIGFQRYGGSQTVSSEIVFVKGVGASARLGELTKFRDKVLVVRQKNARALQFDVSRSRAKAVLFVQDEGAEIQSKPMLDRGGLRAGGQVTANISLDTAKALAKGAGVAESFVVIGDKDSGAVSKVAEKKATIELKALDQPLHNPNVIGWLEGSDPKLKHEHIIIGAHLDHLGKQNGGIYPGADDNASGSTAVLQIAKALSKNGKRPKRSVMLMWFAAEEIGLVGSKHYCNNPIKPLKDCVCMLNIDMIGRNEEKQGEDKSENEDTIHLIGTKKLAESMHETILAANKYVAYKFEYDEENTVFRRSDQASFHDKGIPVSFVFGGFNPYYHQTTDTIQGINFSKVANCARLYYVATFMAAEHGHYVKKSDAKKK